MMPRTTMKMPAVQDDIVPLGGGLDQVTPTLLLGPGKCRRMLNFECGLNGGYARIGGYERSDGQASPSEAIYRVLPLDAPTVLSGSQGITITGSTSGATGVTVTPFAVGATSLVVTLLTGSFQEGEALMVGALVYGTLAAQTVVLTKQQKKQYQNLAADRYRNLIGLVPGTGPVRGVFGATFNGVFNLYAVRDESLTQNRANLCKQTAAGWVVVHGLGSVNSSPNGLLEYNFRNGGPVPIPDNTPFLTAPYFGTVVRTALTGGSWASNTATGKILYRHAGFGLPAVGVPILIGATSVTILTAGEQGAVDGPSGGATPWLLCGGQYEFDIANFYGQETTTRVYAANGVGRAWEFDGEYIMPIDCGRPAVNYTANKFAPTHLTVHQEHLFVGLGSSVLFSGVGSPHDFTASAGGGEFATSDRVTGFAILQGAQGTGSLAVMSRNHTKILYGTALAGPEPFNLVNFATETGALPFTINKLDRVYYLDDRGVIDLKTVTNWGNFASATVTRLMQTFIDQRAGRATCAMVSRTKSQYRLFFNDGFALYVTIDNGSLRGAAPVAFPVPMSCAWSGEDNGGQEIAVVGGTDGFLYQLDRGTSFDGASIRAELLLNWNTMKSPRMRKAIHRASLELQGTDYAELSVAARLGPELTAHLQDEPATLGTPHELDLQWDHFTWDDFTWDSHSEAPLEIDVKGTAERVQYAIVSDSDYLEPFTLTSLTTHYIPRRRIR